MWEHVRRQLLNFQSASFFKFYFVWAKACTCTNFCLAATFKNLYSGADSSWSKKAPGVPRGAPGALLHEFLSEHITNKNSVWPERCGQRLRIDIRKLQSSKKFPEFIGFFPVQRTFSHRNQQFGIQGFPLYSTGHCTLIPLIPTTETSSTSAI